MNNSVFLLVLFIAISLRSGSKVKSYQRLVDQLVQLNQDVGKSKDEVSIIISQIKSSIENIETSAKSFYEKLNENCKNGGILVHSYIKNIKIDLLQVKANVQKAKDDNIKINEEVKKYNQQLEESKNDYKELDKTIQNKIEEISVYTTETEQKLAVIKTLKDIISDELLKPPQEKGATAFSFIQVSSKLISKMEELRNVLENSKSVYTPLILSLVTITESKGFSDDNMLKKILNLLNKLQDNLQGFKEKQSQEGRNEIRLLKAQAKEKVNQIKDLIRMIAVSNSNIKDNLNIVEQSEKNTEQLNAHIARKEEEVAYWDKLCLFEEGIQKKDSEWRVSLKDRLEDATMKILGQI